VSDRQPVRLTDLTPAEEEGWWLLFELADQDLDSWMLVGGQMMQLLAAEHGSIDRVRPTEDIDVVVNVRSKPGGTEQLAGWLLEQGFELAGVSPAGVGHRFARAAVGGPGVTLVDVLAPEGLGARTNIFTVRPARTVQVPGSVQAFERSEVVPVEVSGLSGRPARSGRVRRPNLLGALVAKAAATAIPVRDNPDRDWQDAALLLDLVRDPIEVAAACSTKDRQRLQLLLPLDDRHHVGWANLDLEAYRRGSSALALLLDP
jgi:hypothetical protein